MDFLLWIMHLISSLPIHYEDQGKFFIFSCLALNFIWNIRNNCVFEGLPFNPEICIQLLLGKFNEHLTTMEVNMPLCPSLAHVPSGWTKPLTGTIKFNTDAAIHNGVATIAAVARDCFSTVCGIFVFRETCSFPAAAKAMAILKTVNIARKEEWTAICFESDAKLVIDNINNPWKDLALWSIQGIIDSILKDSKDLRGSFVWTPRTNNKAAHSIRSWGSSVYNLDCISFNYLPRDFLLILNLHCNPWLSLDFGLQIPFG